VLVIREPVPPCPNPDRDAASYPRQGGLLCDGVAVLDDTRELLPDGNEVPPHRPVSATAPQQALRLAPSLHV
jgi:hypothetical protein